MRFGLQAVKRFPLRQIPGFSARKFALCARLRPQSLERIEDHLLQAAGKLMNELIELCSQGLEPLSFVLEGNTEQQILATMNDIQPDWLVLGTHGRKPWQELLLGSVSEDILRHSICPVILV